jgi:tetratricopeptide (TPR) repeat protein
LNYFYDEMEKIHQLNINSSDLNKNGISKNVRKSIALYNRSIANFKVDNIDLAIVDLKKSLSYNSSFCESVKLLGLCYACKGKFSKAENFFKKLRKYNMYSSVANEYLKKVQVEKATSQALDAIRNVENCNVILKLLKSISNNIFSKKFAVLLTVIIAAGLLVLGYRLYPSVKSMSNKAVTPKVAEKGVEDTKYIQLNNDYENLQANFENAKSELDNLKNKYDVTLQLNDAEKSYKGGDYEKTVQILLTLKNSNLEDTSKAKFDTLWNDLKSNAVWVIYKQGNNLYKQKKYTEALPKLSLVEEIGPDQELMPWILYQIGMCYKETNDPSNAIIYFQKVKSDYPNSKYAHYSD